MARPRQFDTDRVVDRAIEVFRRHGYEAASIADLVGAMGINRGSLYGAFGDKAGLFAAALERYHESSPARRLAAAAAAGAPPREAIERLFSELVDFHRADGRRLGCLITNAAAGPASPDPGVAARLAGFRRNLEEALAGLVGRGQQTGEIAPWKEPRALARFLAASIHGLQVTARAESDPKVLDDIAATALGILD